MMTADAIHVFERAGLGKAPFRCVGNGRETYQACPGAPVQVGASCEFCGTGISNVFYVVSADGKRFKVGSECIRHTGDTALVSEAKARRREAARKTLEAQWARDAARWAAAREKLEKAWGVFAAQPHPKGFAGLTLADYYDWMLTHAGNAGRLRVVKEIEAAESKEVAPAHPPRTRRETVVYLRRGRGAEGPVGRLLREHFEGRPEGKEGE